MTDFITTWKTTGASETITLTCGNTGTYNATINWGDGKPDSLITAFNDADLAHVYDIAGTHTITISGVLPHLQIGNTLDKDKIQTVEQWGQVGRLSCQEAFSGCTNLVVNATDAGDFGGVTVFESMFDGCSGLGDTDLSALNVSSAINVRYFFRNCTSGGILNISGWQLVNVTVATDMFSGLGPKNLIAVGTNFSAFTDLGSFFAFTGIVSVDFSNADFSACVSFYQCFRSCTGLVAFTAAGMILNATAPIHMGGMFTTCTALVEVDFSSWDMQEVTNISDMLGGCYSLMLVNISGWNAPKCTTVTGFMIGAGAAGGELIAQNVILSGVASFTSFMSGMGFTSIDLRGWDVRSSTSFYRAFQTNLSLTNANLDDWILNTSATVTMTQMFQSAPLERFTAANWDISKVEIMNGFMPSATLDTWDYNYILIDWGAQTVLSGNVVDMGASKYCTGAPEDGKNLLIGQGWTINDGGLETVCPDEPPPPVTVIPNYLQLGRPF